MAFFYYLGGVGWIIWCTWPKLPWLVFISKSQISAEAGNFPEKKIGGIIAAVTLDNLTEEDALLCIVKNSDGHWRNEYYWRRWSFWYNMWRIKNCITWVRLFNRHLFLMRNIMYKVNTLSLLHFYINMKSQLCFLYLTVQMLKKYSRTPLIQNSG